jgi:hypothetical protein
LELVGRQANRERETTELRRFEHLKAWAQLNRGGGTWTVWAVTWRLPVTAGEGLGIEPPRISGLTSIRVRRPLAVRPRRLEAGGLPTSWTPGRTAPDRGSASL